MPTSRMSETSGTVLIINDPMTQLTQENLVISKSCLAKAATKIQSSVFTTLRMSTVGYLFLYHIILRIINIILPLGDHFPQLVIPLPCVFKLPIG